MCEIKNIVFDLGNVILRYDPEAMLLRYTSDPQEIDLCVKTVFGSPQWQACDRGGDPSRLHGKTAAEAAHLL